MAVPEGRSVRSMRPRQATPAERAEEFAAEQAQLKQEAADRRAAKEKAEKAAVKSRSRRRS